MNDIKLLMAIGGVFELLFFAATFGFVYAITPSKYKDQKKKSAVQADKKESNRASMILVGTLFLLSFLHFNYTNC